jgi:metal iron transporter
MGERLDITPLPSADEKKIVAANVSDAQITPIPTDTPSETGRLGALKGWLLPRHEQTAWAKFLRFFTFLGPGAIISVAYIDPDNYQTAISSGGSFQYKLLFMVLVSNIIAIYLQVRSVSASSPLQAHSGLLLTYTASSRCP